MPGRTCTVRASSVGAPCEYGLAIGSPFKRINAPESLIRSRLGIHQDQPDSIRPENALVFAGAAWLRQNRAAQKEHDKGQESGQEEARGRANGQAGLSLALALAGTADPSRTCHGAWAQKRVFADLLRNGVMPQCAERLD